MGFLWVQNLSCRFYDMLREGSRSEFLSRGDCISEHLGLWDTWDFNLVFLQKAVSLHVPILWLTLSSGFHPLTVMGSSIDYVRDDEICLEIFWDLLKKKPLNKFAASENSDMTSLKNDSQVKATKFNIKEYCL